LKTLRNIQVFAILLFILGIGTISYYNGTLPKSPTPERTHEIKASKFPPVFSTANEYKLYCTAFYTCAGAIALTLICTAAMIRLSKKERRV
jgi:hypothetical protein